jgi:hypothetical protein
MEKVHLTLNKNRKEESGYSKKEKCHQGLEDTVSLALKITS